VFDFRAPEGLAGEPCSSRPQPGSREQFLSFDLFVPNEPGYVENVPAVWISCFQQHVTLPLILPLLSPLSHFVEHMHGGQSTTYLWAGEATPQHRVLLPPAAARALSRRLATVRSSAVLVHLNARAGSSTLTSRSTTDRRGRCGCACLAGELRRSCLLPSCACSAARFSSRRASSPRTSTSRRGS
jgi:hypothetical protein